ncbi:MULTISPECIES: TolC family outer membrane protein [Thalassobaculum]|uniref:Outer membrane protein n=1 Tax=Thalassobaculum litoreum DSM 18839 TaxID=1123362 RepID=A0A8G2BEA7_9PROT|nr:MULTISPECIES: TolC family outer membrane protein [Thalassobaculum]SDF13332.1 outer membrane protein [Thalassobaculum litoreum DSM 18839]
MTSFAKSLRSSAAVVALLAGIAVIGTPAAQGQTLEEALSLAYETNPELLAARADLRRTDESVTQAKGGWRPSISAAGSFGITDVKGENRGVTTTDDHSYPITGSITATQPLYTFGRVDAQVDEADANVEAARAGLFQSEQSTLLDAVVAYVNVIRDTSILELQINNVERLDKQLEATRDRFRVGEVTRTDVAQSDARRASSEADRTQAEGNLITSRVAFERVVGTVPTTLTEPSIPPGLPTTRDEAVDIATQESYTLIQAKFQELAARHVVSQAEAELLPELNLVTQAEQTYNTNGGDNEVTTLTAEVQLSVPIYQQGVVYSQVRSAKENVNRIRLLVDNERRAVVENAASAFEDYKTALAQIESLRSEVNSAEIALDGVQQEATVGARTVLDVLDAEQELLDAQVNLVTADRNAIVAAFSLLASLGRLTAQDLGLPVEIYDYDRHYLAVESKYYGTEPPGRMPGN